MAINVSNDFHAKVTSGQLGLRVLARLAPLRRKINPFLRMVSQPTKSTANIACSVSPGFDAVAEHYQKERWAFVRDVFPADFHAALRDTFPARCFFEPVNSLYKSYDRVSITDTNKSRFQNFQAYLALSDYLKTPEFEERVSAIAGVPGLRSSGHLHLTKSWPGTYLVPHQDSAMADDNIVTHINAIFFIEGSGGPNSGGLTLAHDNELKSVIFEPQDLTNTCLIYDIKEPFFHGFTPIAFGKFRHAVIMNWRLAKEQK